MCAQGGESEGMESTFFAYNQILHRHEDLETLRKVKTIQNESIVIMIFISSFIT